MNDADKEAGGTYLFESEKALNSYLAGPIVPSMKSNPILSNLSVKSFEVLEHHSAATRTPLKETLADSG